MNDLLTKCNLCPRHCNINRHETVGFCKASDTLKIARADLHFFEEPCISGDKGSGTIFFTYCNLKCAFCQNYEISSNNVGREITIEKFSDICLNLQNKGALNINLVTPTHYIPLIKEGLKLAKLKGLTIPIVYNTSSYETTDSLKLLDGLIDIYLPDFKYYNDDTSIKYSSAPNYVNVCKNAISEMYRQVGKPIFDNDGIMKKGVIVRHLLLPNMEDDSKKIIEYLYNTYNDNIYMSIMNQYTPMKKLKYEELNYTINDDVYDGVINFAYDLGVRNAFIQEGETQKKSFIPDFKNQEF